MSLMYELKPLIQKHGLQRFLMSTVAALESIERDLDDKAQKGTHANITRESYRVARTILDRARKSITHKINRIGF